MKTNIKYEKITNLNEYEYINRNGYHISAKTLHKGEKYLFHWHDYYEFEIILSGSAVHTFGNSTYEITRGDAHLITPSEFHSIEIISDVSILNIRFREEFFRDKLMNHISSVSKAFHRFTEQDVKYIEERTGRINSLNPRSEFYHECVRSILTEIIIIFLDSKEIKKTDLNSPPLVQKSADFINKNFRADLTLSDVAEKFAVTPKHLGNVFKKSVGVNFNEYLNCLRLKYACSLLTSSDLSVKEIAYASGYNSEQYFLYIFKKYMKTKPTEYRKNIPQNPTI